jgi:hypothetical protein
MNIFTHSIQTESIEMMFFLIFAIFETELIWIQKMKKLDLYLTKNKTRKLLKQSENHDIEIKNT